MPSFKNVSPFGDLNVATGGAESYFVKHGETLDLDDGPLAESLASSPDFEQQPPSPSGPAPSQPSPSAGAAVISAPSAPDPAPSTPDASTPEEN
jgi:hypothetical protein